jgi:hypothetical protein
LEEIVGCYKRLNQRAASAGRAAREAETGVHVHGDKNASGNCLLWGDLLVLVGFPAAAIQSAREAASFTGSFVKGAATKKDCNRKLDHICRCSLLVGRSRYIPLA